MKALQIYDETRRPPTSAIVYANRGQGPDYVMQLCHERCPDGWKTEDGVESVIPRTELEEIGQRYKRVAGFDVQSVNEKARRTANSNGYGLQRTVAHESQKAENVAQKVQAGVELN